MITFVLSALIFFLSISPAQSNTCLDILADTAQIHSLINDIHAPVDPIKRKYLERLLAHSEIAEIGTAMEETSTAPKIITFSNGMQAIFKSHSMEQGRLNYQTEIVAYELDKAMELLIVPPTIERNIRGENGSLQFFVPHTVPTREVFRSNASANDTIKLFDLFIINDDRNYGGENWLISSIDRSVEYAIDHSHAFYHINPDTQTIIPRVDLNETYELLSGFIDEIVQMDASARSRFGQKLIDLGPEQLENIILPRLGPEVLDNLIYTREALIDILRQI